MLDRAFCVVVFRLHLRQVRGRGDPRFPPGNSGDSQRHGRPRERRRPGRRGRRRCGQQAARRGRGRRRRGGPAATGRGADAAPVYRPGSLHAVERRAADGVRPAASRHAQGCARDEHRGDRGDDRRRCVRCGRWEGPRDALRPWEADGVPHHHLGALRFLSRFNLASPTFCSAVSFAPARSQNRAQRTACR